MYLITSHYLFHSLSSLCVACIFSCVWEKQRDNVQEQTITKTIHQAIQQHLKLAVKCRINSQDKPQLCSKWAFYLKAHVLELSTFSRKNSIATMSFVQKKRDNTKILILNFNTSVGVFFLMHITNITITIYNSLVI